MRKSKFSELILGFMDRQFDHDTHEVCYLISDDEDSYIHKDISLKQHEFRLLSRNFRMTELIRFISFQKKYDFVLLHSFFLNPVLTLFFWAKTGKNRMAFMGI